MAYIIAEAGVNHNGNLSMAKDMIYVAKEAGCDCIKFQTFQPDMLVTRKAARAEYQIANTGSTDSQYDMLKSLTLSASDYEELKMCCEQNGIDFLSTPFDIKSVDLLREIGVNKWKIPSGEITNKQLLEKIGSLSQPVILSTGMSDIKEVETALNWIRNAGSNDITLLHCTSNYPTAFEDVNMRAMITLRDTFNVPVGYSDHTLGIAIPLMAVAMGAQVIEKHFTLNKKLSGPDHVASLEPNELKEMVKGIREIELAFGDGNKIPVKSEYSTAAVARKSIVYTKNLLKGAIIDANDLSVKRPGTGIEPCKLDEIIGRRLKHDVKEDTLVSYYDFI